MKNHHFSIGDIRVERSSTVPSGHIQIETSQGELVLIEIGLTPQVNARYNIKAIFLPSQMFDRYRRMKERQLRSLADEYPD